MNCFVRLVIAQICENAIFIAQFQLIRESRTELNFINIFEKLNLQPEMDPNFIAPKDVLLLGFRLQVFGLPY